MAILRDGYKSLTLRFHGNYDGLGGDPYIENPREVPFFQRLIRTFVVEAAAALRQQLSDDEAHAGVDASATRAHPRTPGSAPPTPSTPPKLTPTSLPKR